MTRIMTTRRGPHRRWLVVSGACIALLLSDCALRVPQSQVIAAAGGTTAANVRQPVGPSSHQGTTGGSTTTTTGVSTGATSTTLPSGTGGTTPSGVAAQGSTNNPSTGSQGGGLSTPTKSTIILGNIGDYDGIPGSVVAGAAPILQVWAKWTNAHGGIAGHPVEVITADASGDPSKNLALTQQLVSQDHAIAFLSNEVALSVTGSLNYLDQNQIPVVGGDGVTSYWWNNPMLFPTGTNIDDIALAVAKIAAQAGRKKFGILWCAEASFVCQALNTVLDQNGGAAKEGVDLVYDAEVSLAQPDFTAECLDAQAAGVQELFTMVDQASIGRIAQDCAAQNYHPILSTASLGVQTAEDGNPDLIGLTAPVQTFPWMATGSAESAFDQAVATYDPGLQLSASSSQAWTAGELFASLAPYLSGPNPTSADVLKGLWATKNQTLGGLTPPMTFVQGQPAQSSSCYFTAAMNGQAQWSDPEGTNLTCL